LITEKNELAQYYQEPAYENWRRVSQLLHHNAQPTDAIIAVRAEPTINWYYPPAAAALDTYSSSDPIWAAMAAHPRRWFILSSYSFKRDQGLRQWLREQGAIQLTIDRRVTVYFQQEGLSPEEQMTVVQQFQLPQEVNIVSTRLRGF
jgi:hypothetical protein